MKKVIIILLSLVVLATPLTVLGQAFSGIEGQDPDIQKFTREAASEAGYDIKKTRTALATVAGTIVSAFLSFIGIIFITYTLYGGYLWMTAGGNEEKVTKAKAIIRNGIVGMIIIFSVWGIYLVVAAIFNPDIESFPTSGF